MRTLFWFQYRCKVVCVIEALFFSYIVICRDVLKFVFLLIQGKFIRIHFGPTGKLAGADIETCKLNLNKIYTTLLRKM